MIETLVSIIAILTVFGALVAYNYIRDLRRDLRSARDEALTAWRLYDNTNRELCELQGKPVPAPYFQERRGQNSQEKPGQGFHIGAVGPTAIVDREQRRTRADNEMRQPAFANPGVLTGRSTPEDIAAAAREATNGDGLD